MEGEAGELEIAHDVKVGRGYQVTMATASKGGGRDRQEGVRTAAGLSSP